MTEVFGHQPVMLQPVLEGLNLKAGGIYIDATFGRGGHSRAILERLDAGARLLVMDKDARACEAAQQLAREDERVQVHCGSYAELEGVVAERAWREKVDGVFLDLGVSSPQLDDATRGFSFLRDGPLDMRMDTSQGRSAAEWLAQAAEDEIVYVLKSYGEERFARRIARAILRQREQQPLSTTAQLAALVAAAVPVKEKHKHPATRSFQAIRIHINRELEELSKVLPQTVSALAPKGRLVVISFHSLEDRIVKRFIRDEQRGPELPPDLPVIPAVWQPRLHAVGKPQRADKDEISANPRARSAVLRVAERAA